MRARGTSERRTGEYGTLAGGWSAALLWTLLLLDDILTNMDMTFGTAFGAARQLSHSAHLYVLGTHLYLSCVSNDVY